MTILCEQKLGTFRLASHHHSRQANGRMNVIARGLLLLSSWTCALSMSSPALAYGGTGWGPITMLTIYRGSVRTGALLEFSATFTNGDNCPQTANLFIDFSSTEAPDGKALYATALAAQLAGKSVNIGTLGCSSEGFPIVYGINVR